MNEQELIEKLADKEHASWARWMQYLFQKSYKREDGAVVIPVDLVERWQRQVDTPYTELSEQEKQSDRDEVAHILPIIRERIDSVSTPNDITRVVAIEHAGETIKLEVHVHLSQEEIERIVTPAVLKSLSRQWRMQSRPLVSVPLSVDPDDYPIV